MFPIYCPYCMWEVPLGFKFSCNLSPLGLCTWRSINVKFNRESHSASHVSDNTVVIGVGHILQLAAIVCWASPVTKYCNVRANLSRSYWISGYSAFFCNIGCNKRHKLLRMMTVTWESMRKNIHGREVSSPLPICETLPFPANLCIL